MAVRIFRHYVSKAFILLGLADGFIGVLSMYAGVSLRLGEISPATKMLAAPLLPKAIIFAGILLISLMVTGLYQRGLRDSPRGIAGRILAGFFLVFVGMTLVFYLFPVLVIGRGAFMLAMMVAFTGVAASRYLFYKISSYERIKRRIMVLGVAEEALQIAMLRRKTDMHGVKVMGYVPIHGEQEQVDPGKIVRIVTTLPQLVEEFRIEELVIAADDRHPDFPIEEVIECKMRGVQINDMISFYEQQTGKICLNVLHHRDIIFLDGFSPAVFKGAGKRFFDVFVSLFILLATAPIMVLTTLAIAMESWGKGTVLYRQERVGRDGQTFEVLKFRSMRMDAEKDGKARWASRDDPRVTAIGNFIRKTRIDELPQLFNVLMGDMSFVGPRPERPPFVEELSTVIPYYAMRHRVKPGITGWAQVSYPYGASIQDAEQKLQYDLYYIKNYSMFLDLSILLQTVQVVLWGQGGR